MWNVYPAQSDGYEKVFPGDHIKEAVSAQTEGAVMLIATPLRFYSHNDEGLFFCWLRQIACIEKSEGVGRELRLSISSNTISEADLLELMALYRRYNLENRKQLKIFKNETNKHWFEEWFGNE
jgi:hypothetical protein